MAHDVLKQHRHARPRRATSSGSNIATLTTLFLLACTVFTCNGMSSNEQSPVTTTTTTAATTVAADVVSAAPAPAAAVTATTTTTETTEKLSSFQARMDQILKELPPETLDTPIEPVEAGRMLGALFHLNQAVKAARIGGKSLTPLMLQMMASQMTGGSGGDPSKVQLNLNMKEMMPLIAQFLDATSRKCMHTTTTTTTINGTAVGGGSGGGNLSSPLTAAASALSPLFSSSSSPLSALGAAVGLGGSGGDSESTLTAISQLLAQQQAQQQQQQATAEKAAAAAAAAAAEKEKEKAFDIQQFVMQIATKMIADMASSAVSGGRSAGA